MQRLAARARAFVGAQRGLTATEYAILISLILVTALAALRLLGVSLAKFCEYAATLLPAGTA